MKVDKRANPLVVAFCRMSAADCFLSILVKCGEHFVFHAFNVLNKFDVGKDYFSDF
jgi:hypothetical protein